LEKKLKKINRKKNGKLLVIRLDLKTMQIILPFAVDKFAEIKKIIYNIIFYL